MTVNYTTNLALGQPVTGTESGTWGDDVNNSVTSYLDIAIAGGLAITITTTDVTLSLTQGTSSATNIGSTTAQYAILNVSGAMTAARNLILPSSSRQYVINNNTTGGFALTVKGAATTGVTMVNGESSHIYWNGSDYAKLSNAPGGTGTFTNLTYTGTLTGSTGVIAIGTNQIYKDSSGNVGIGTTSPTYQTQIYGTGQTTAALTDAGNKGGSLLLNTPTVSGGDGGALLFGAGGSGAKPYAAIKGLLADGAGNTTGNLAFSTRNATADTALTERMRIDSSGNVGIGASTTAQLRSQLTVLGAGQATAALQDSGNTDGTIQINSNVNAGGRGGALTFGALLDNSTYTPFVAIKGLLTNGSNNGLGSLAFSYRALTTDPTLTEGMRLNYDGNVGIGTSSPGAKLDIGGTNNSVFFKNSGATTGYALATISNTGGVFQYGVSSSTGTFWGSGNAGNYSVNIGTTSAVNLGFGTSDTLRMVLDSSGNLGLGVTPSAWSPQKAMQIASYTALADNPQGGGGFGLSSNAYEYSSGAYKYLQSYYAALYRTYAGQHQWYTAPSGTAGNAISFTQAMSLLASGDLAIGRTSAIGGARVSAEKVTGSPTYAAYLPTTGTETAFLFVNPNGTVGSITTNGSATLYNVTSDQRLKENIQDAEPASDLIDALQVRKFDWKADGNHQRYGFVAQELVTVAPEAVHQPADPEQMMAVDYSKLVPMLVKEIQSLRKRLADAGIA